MSLRVFEKQSPVAIDFPAKWGLLRDEHPRNDIHFVEGEGAYFFTNPKWIMKARRDLLSAKKLARGKEPLLDTAIYHCQQTAEKTIKGWLVYHDISFGKTHEKKNIFKPSTRRGNSMNSFVQLYPLK